MDTSTQIFSQEKRKEKAQECRIIFEKLDKDTSYYTVLNDDGEAKYIGRIEIVKSLDEYCTCPDQFHRNTRFYKDEHGFSLQCKHMIQAKKLRGWGL